MIDVNDIIKTTCSQCGNATGSIGEVDTDDLRARGWSEKVLKAMEEMSEDTKKHMSPPGALKLPPLLERRRLEFGIPDEAFTYQSVYDRILLWQIPPREYAKGTFGQDSQIVMSDQARDREAREAPRGIVISAGLTALDEIRSHGVDLGHIVTFVRAAPWRMTVGIIGAKTQQVIILQSGDLVSSEDLRAQLLSGEAEIKAAEEDGVKTHYINGKGVPADAFTPADY